MGFKDRTDLKKSTTVGHISNQQFNSMYHILSPKIIIFSLSVFILFIRSHLNHFFNILKNILTS